MFGLNKLHLAGYGLALAIIAYLLFNPKVEYVPIEYKEDISKRDTVIVETVKRDTVFIKDTVEVNLNIPDPVEKGSTKVYQTLHSDQFISIKVTSEVDGILIDQSIWYIPKIRQITIDRVSNTTVDRYFKPQRVFEDPNKRNYRELWGGLDIEDFNNGLSLTPNIMYIGGNVAYEVGYNLNEHSLQQFDINALRVGVKFKIF